MDAVGADHMAVSYDRRGYRTTQSELEDFSAVADLIAVIDSVAEGQMAILVGCSFGGKSPSTPRSGTPHASPGWSSSPPTSMARPLRSTRRTFERCLRSRRAPRTPAIWTG
ncbi:alpha/beta hydrolase [Methylobacterium sp. 092160098-2]|uniref:alpha/beta hydrolase n=1 Tax=Methylobacterium sp. 092160098-2 TaxID=3025129 RepID=UPI0023819F83|nr:alpha/beta hydrolase [Methylobacterium sp. 092160098-2]MDE4914764.1 alpha/beta hydrolase [Methylobacterium sp. 092160098-2]